MPYQVGSFCPQTWTLAPNCEQHCSCHFEKSPQRPIVVHRFASFLEMRTGSWGHVSSFFYINLPEKWIESSHDGSLMEIPILFRLSMGTFPSRQWTFFRHGLSGKCPTKWVNLALKRGRLPSIISSTTINRLRVRFWSGSLCSIIVNSWHLTLPHRHLLTLKRGEMWANNPEVPYGLTWFGILSRLPFMKLAWMQTTSRYETRNWTSFQRFSVRVRSVWKWYGHVHRRRKQAVSRWILFRLGRLLSLGSAVIFGHFLFASTKEMMLCAIWERKPVTEKRPVTAAKRSRRKAKKNWALHKRAIVRTFKPFIG